MNRVSSKASEESSRRNGWKRLARQRPGTVARLAGALELLGWSGLVSAGRPGAIGRDHVETAAALWTSYFRPHARAVFQQAAPSNCTAQVRRTARWLKAAGKAVVSREDIRRDALSQSINAHEVEMVIGRLTTAGMLRFMDTKPRRTVARAFGVGRSIPRWRKWAEWVAPFALIALFAPRSAQRRRAVGAPMRRKT